MSQRKGVLTPEQEKQIDDLIKLEGIAESLDGPTISLADNQGVERILKIADQRYPGAREDIIYPIIDTILQALPKKK